MLKKDVRNLIRRVKRKMLDKKQWNLEEEKMRKLQDEFLKGKKDE